MSVAYSARQAEAVSDREAAFQLWEANFGGGARRSRHRWYYVDNPAGKGVLFLLEAATANGAREIVGCAGIASRTFHRGDTSLRAGVLVNLVVDAKHRTLLPSLRLQRTVREYARERFDFSYGFPTDAAVETCRRTGLLDIGPLVRYRRILCFERYLSRRVRFSAIARSGGVLLDTVNRWIELTRRALVPRSFALEWPTSIDARFERLWSEVRASHPLIGDRGGDFLRWRFGRRPGGPAQIAALVRGGSRAIRAYAAVVAKQEEVARIEDLLSVSEKDLGALLDLLIPKLRRQGFAAVEVSFFGSKRITAILRSRGFVAHGARRVVVDPGRSLACDPAIHTDPENWYLTDADEDT